MIPQITDIRPLRADSDVEMAVYAFAQEVDMLEAMAAKHPQEARKHRKAIEQAVLKGLTILARL